jgi:hypothetical protein
MRVVRGDDGQVCPALAAAGAEGPGSATGYVAAAAPPSSADTRSYAPGAAGWSVMSRT